MHIFVIIPLMRDLNYAAAAIRARDPNYEMRTQARRHEADPTLREKYPLVLPVDGGGAGVSPIYPLPKELRPGSNVL
jgi:hypothetical protein